MNLLSRCKTGVGALALVAAVGLVFPGLAMADSGVATWYGPGFQGNTMYNGQPYNMYDPTTTASNTYPLGTWLKVTNPANGKSVVVQVRDRGAFSQAFDLSYAAFKAIADPALMGIHVTYEVVSGPSGQPVATPALPASTARPKPSSRSSQRQPATQYVVQPGDTLGGIADKLGMSEASLALLNGLSNPNSITVGQALQLKALTSNTATGGEPASQRTYVATDGDTLSSIAQKFGVSVESLSAANDLTDPNALAVGQKLVIPGGKTPPPTKTYLVQQGDTLFGIASHFGISQDSLAGANDIANPALIQPGMHLTIPGQ